MSAFKNGSGLEHGTPSSGNSLRQETAAFGSRQESVDIDKGLNKMSLNESSTSRKSFVYHETMLSQEFSSLHPQNQEAKHFSSNLGHETQASAIKSSDNEAVQALAKRNQSSNIKEPAYSSDTEEELEITEVLETKVSNETDVGRYDNAERILSKILRRYEALAKRRPSYKAKVVITHMNMATTLEKQEKWNDLLASLQSARACGPDASQEAEIAMKTVQILILKGDIDGASESCSRLLTSRRRAYGKHDSQFLAAKALKVRILLLQGEFDEADAYYSTLPNNLQEDLKPYFPQHQETLVPLNKASSQHQIPSHSAPTDKNVNVQQDRPLDIVPPEASPKNGKARSKATLVDNSANASTEALATASTADLLSIVDLSSNEHSSSTEDLLSTKSVLPTEGLSSTKDLSNASTGNLSIDQYLNASTEALDGDARHPPGDAGSFDQPVKKDVPLSKSLAIGDAGYRSSSRELISYYLAHRTDDHENMLKEIAATGSITDLNDFCIDDNSAWFLDIGDTALHIASRYNNIIVASELARDPKLLRKTNGTQKRPLDIAVAAKNDAMIKLLVASDDKATSKSKFDSNNALDGALLDWNEEWINILLKHGAPVYPKHFWYTRHSVWFTQLLIYRGASLLFNEEVVESPLICVCAGYRADEEVVKLLLDNGADVNQVDGMGNSPLHLAVRVKNKNVVRVLLENGAAVQAQNQDGKTAIECTGLLDRSMVRLLKEYGARK